VAGFLIRSSHKKSDRGGKDVFGITYRGEAVSQSAEAKKKEGVIKREGNTAVRTL